MIPRWWKSGESRGARLASARPLEAAGVTFTNGDEPGVKLRKAQP